MTATSDKLYGRRGGRFAEWIAETPTLPVTSLPVTVEQLRTHLVAAHGMPAEVVDAHQPAEWIHWHAAEHKHRRIRRPVLRWFIDHTHNFQETDQ